MSRLVAPTAGMRSRAPEFVAGLDEVRVAETEEELEAVFRFRYSVYVDEFGRSVGTPDHRRRRLQDEADHEPGTTCVLYLPDGDGGVLGTARIRHWHASEIPEEVRSTYSMDRFDCLSGRGAIEGSRLMIAKRHRGKTGLASLQLAAYQLAATEFAADAWFVYCDGGTVHPYFACGFRPYSARLVSTSDGTHVPLVMLLSDRPHFERVGSYFAPMVDEFYGEGKRACVEVDRDSELLDPDTTPIRLEPLASGRYRSLLAGLDGDVVSDLAKQSLTIRLSAGELLIPNGLTHTALFIVLDGEFTQTGGDGHDRHALEAGDIIGQVGPPTTWSRSTVSVTASASAEVLVLRRRFVENLYTRHPADADRLVAKIAQAFQPHASRQVHHAT